MPPSAIILAVAILMAGGCRPAPPATSPGPPAGHVDVGRLPEQPFHDDEQPRADLLAPNALAPTDPAAVAISHISAGLMSEGLEVIELAADVMAVVGGRVTVRVVASHSTGPAGEPYASVYELDLTRQADGSWTVNRSRTVG